MAEREPGAEPSLIGGRHGYVDGPQKVSGGARYVADLTLPGLLWAKILRSPHPHARITALDTGEAAWDAGRQLLETASEAMEASPDDLTVRAGDVMVRGVPSRRVPIAEIMARRVPRQIIGQASTRAGSQTHIVNSFAAHFAEVE